MLEDFIKKLHQQCRISDAFELYARYLKKYYNIDHITYSFLTDHHLIGQKAGHSLVSNYPTDWLAHYQLNRLDIIDPVVCNAPKTNRPFFWNDLLKNKIFTKKQIHIIKEAEESGLYNGIGVPIHGPRGELAGFGLAFSDKAANLDSRIDIIILSLISQAFHNFYYDLIINRNPKYPHLTPKEKEIIQLLAIGKTEREIAMISNSTLAGIHFHIKNIYRKLDANTKTLAIVKALRYGLIEMESLALV